MADDIFIGKAAEGQYPEEGLKFAVKGVQEGDYRIIKGKEVVVMLLAKYKELTTAGVVCKPDTVGAFLVAKTELEKLNNNFIRMMEPEDPEPAKEPQLALERHIEDKAGITASEAALAREVLESAGEAEG